MIIGDCTYVPGYTSGGQDERLFQTWLLFYVIEQPRANINLNDISRHVRDLRTPLVLKMSGSSGGRGTLCA